MARPRLVLLEDGYRLEINGKSSEEVDYGEPVELHAGGNHYVAYVDVDEEGTPSSPLETTVYRVHGMEAAEVVDEMGDDAGVVPEAGSDVVDEGGDGDTPEEVADENEENEIEQETDKQDVETRE